MKYSVSLICILISSCSSLNKEELKNVINNNSFQWHVSNFDTSVVKTIHFFHDSLFVFEARELNDTSVYGYSTGHWHVEPSLFRPSLWLSQTFPDSESELTFQSQEDGTLNFEYKMQHFRDPKRSYRYYKENHHIKAIPIAKKIKRDIKHLLLGSWNDPIDSFPAPFREWERTGRILTNPTFKFSKDSFNIRTEEYRKKGTYQIVNVGRNLIILESEKNYKDNSILEIEYIDSTVIRILLDKKYTLRRLTP